jgi:hypothetical protein
MFLQPLPGVAGIEQLHGDDGGGETTIGPKPHFLAGESPPLKTQDNCVRISQTSSFDNTK